MKYTRTYSDWLKENLKSSKNKEIKKREIKKIHGQEEREINQLDILIDSYLKEEKYANE